MFIKHNSFGKLTTLMVYMDDIIVIGNDEGEIQRQKTYLSNEFEIKDLRSLKYFLKIEVACSKGGIYFPTKIYTQFAKGDKDVKMQTSRDSD